MPSAKWRHPSRYGTRSVPTTIKTGKSARPTSDLIVPGFADGCFTSDTQAGFFHGDRRVGRNTLGQPNARSDDGSLADGRAATKDGCVCVDDDIVFDGWVAFGIPHKFAFTIGRKTQSSERDTLVQLDSSADFARFTDNHSGAVVDKKMTSDRRAWMDVDSGFLVSPLGHHAGDERDADVMQFMG